MRPYRKRTHVGEERILRRLSESLSRNSASWCCNFGRRHAIDCELTSWAKRLMVADTRWRRLFNKNTGPCKVDKNDVYGLTPARCWKVKGSCSFFGTKQRTEAPVNGGRNYNGPKVAKFLVG
jgi:hypothetical protein